jgi:hypothetical protein
VKGGRDSNLGVLSYRPRQAGSRKPSPRERVFWSSVRERPPWISASCCHADRVEQREVQGARGTGVLKGEPALEAPRAMEAELGYQVEEPSME